MKDHHHISRRKFLGQASCASLGMTTMLSTLINLKSMNAAAISNSSVALGGDYKALVCFLFSGGKDSFNMLIPTNQSAYQEYSQVRSNLAIPYNQILALNNVDYGVHPSMPEVQNMYNQGKLAFISNIGTLVEPVTKEQVWNDESKLPLGLFSHSDQIRQWQTALPQERSAVGWGGKIADLIGDTNSNENISMNISMNGGNMFQTGAKSIPYTMDPWEGANGINGYNEDWIFNEMRKQSIDNMVDKQYADVFKQTYVDVIRVSRDAYLQISEQLETLSPFTTQFSENDISQSMHMVAKMIALRESLGMKRQIFFVEYDGWDHHDEVLDSQYSMLSVVSKAMGEFNQVMEEMQLSDCVTTFTVSEFGRTLTSNGNGTDHGWGGNVMVSGGAVNGGRIFGDYPILGLESELEIGGGVYIPTTSTDVYFAELAMWLGVAATDLTTLFPNLGNFYSIGSQTPPLGFLNL